MGIIVIPPCDTFPQQHPGNCNKSVLFDEQAYTVNISSYDAITLKVGTTITSVDGNLVFTDNKIRCLCDLTEYQNILTSSDPVIANQAASTSQ